MNVYSSAKVLEKFGSHQTRLPYFNRSRTLVHACGILWCHDRVLARTYSIRGRAVIVVNAYPFYGNAPAKRSAVQRGIPFLDTTPRYLLVWNPDDNCDLSHFQTLSWMLAAIKWMDSAINTGAMVRRRNQMFHLTNRLISILGLDAMVPFAAEYAKTLEITPPLSRSLRTDL